MQEARHQLRAAVAECFPQNSRIIAIPAQADLVLAISWPLPGDPRRPSKRSKVIRLTIDADLLDAYALASSATRARADKRLSVALRQRLAHFDPDHQRSPYEEPLIVPWNIARED